MANSTTSTKTSRKQYRMEQRQKMKDRQQARSKNKEEQAMRSQEARAGSPPSGSVSNNARMRGTNINTVLVPPNTSRSTRVPEDEKGSSSKRQPPVQLPQRDNISDPKLNASKTDNDDHKDALSPFTDVQAPPGPNDDGDHRQRRTDDPPRIASPNQDEEEPQLPIDKEAIDANFASDDQKRQQQKSKNSDNREKTEFVEGTTILVHDELNNDNKDSTPMRVIYIRIFVMLVVTVIVILGITLIGRTDD